MTGLTDLFREIGDEKLTFQILGQVVSDVGETENGLTEITFVTDQVEFDDILQKRDTKVAFIVWAEKEDTDRAVQALGLGPKEEE